MAVAAAAAGAGEAAAGAEAGGAASGGMNLSAVFSADTSGLKAGYTDAIKYSRQFSDSTLDLMKTGTNAEKSWKNYNDTVQKFGKNSLEARESQIDMIESMKALDKQTNALQNSWSQFKETLGQIPKPLAAIATGILLVLGPSDVFRSAIGGMFQIWGALIDEIMGALAPAWTPFLQILGQLATSIQPILPMLTKLAQIIGKELVSMFQEFRPEIELIIKGFALLIGLGILGFIVALIGVFKTILLYVHIVRLGWEALTGGIGKFINVIKTVKSVWDGLGGGIGVLLTLINLIRNGLGGAFEYLRGLWGGAVSFFTGIWNGLVGAFKWVMNGILGTVESAVNYIIDKVNQIPGENLVFGGPLQHISLPRLAAGGIAYRPTIALIGEKGPEAVVPLTGANARNAGFGRGGGDINLNFGPGSISLGGKATQQDARDFVNMIRQELDRYRSTGINTLR